MNPVRAKNSFITYVLRSLKDGNLYTGCTGDLRKRLSEHEAGMVTSTKGRGSMELVYFESCVHPKDAFARERYLKTGMGKRYLRNRLKCFLALTG